MIAVVIAFCEYICLEVADLVTHQGDTEALHNAPRAQN